jgi:hypothetical protein
MRIVKLLPLVLLLAACATPAERAAQKQSQMDEMMMVYGPACEKLGYKVHSDLWRDCVLRLDARDSSLRGYPMMTNCVGQGGFLNCWTY